MQKISCFTAFLLLTFWAGGTGAEVKNPDTFVLANYGNIRTIDPSAAYDATSSQKLWNIYETLVFFDGSYTD